MAAIDHDDVDDKSIVFIIASPRSGTTLLGEVLGRHSQIAEWYEPYFVWDWECGFGEDDLRDAQFATPSARARIIAEFARVKRDSNADIVVEKLPEHAFQIPFLNAVFPNARYIHLVRDGRDVVHSIHREWGKRSAIAGGKNLLKFMRLTWSMLQRQPLWRHRIMAIVYELRQRLRSGGSVLNKAKWAQGGGWGPRFKGWRSVYNTQPVLAFNAHQWQACEQQIKRDLAGIPTERKLSLRYEDFVRDPHGELLRIMHFIDLAIEPQMTKDVDAHRTAQWTVFDASQRQQVNDVIGEDLRALGYVSNDEWLTP